MVTKIVPMLDTQVYGVNNMLKTGMEWTGTSVSVKWENKNCIVIQGKQNIYTVTEIYVSLACFKL